MNNVAFREFLHDKSTINIIGAIKSNDIIESFAHTETNLFLLKGDIDVSKYNNIFILPESDLILSIGYNICFIDCYSPEYIEGISSISSGLNIPLILMISQTIEEINNTVIINALSKCRRAFPIFLNEETQRSWNKYISTPNVINFHKHELLNKATLEILKGYYNEFTLNS